MCDFLLTQSAKEGNSDEDLLKFCSLERLRQLR
jgi:hypothetical protein